jgi:hypothetical protein
VILCMVANDQQLQTTLQRIAWFQSQVAHLRQTETNPLNYRSAVSGFLAEIDRMQLSGPALVCVPLLGTSSARADRKALLLRSSGTPTRAQVPAPAHLEAQLLCRLSSGAQSARTPPASWAIKLS